MTWGGGEGGYTRNGGQDHVKLEVVNCDVSSHVEADVE